MMLDRDTIAAIATAPGKGGIGVVRLSGAKAKAIGEAITQKTLQPRRAFFCAFLDANGVIDEGIALYFAAPASFTGEDVVELQGHGGPQVLNLLLQACVQHGARIARAGEFSERAFHNEKIDLAQAEAIADLIDAGSAQAARNALHSLQGVFSNAVHELVEQLLRLRMYVEAALDFPEEEIDFLADKTVAAQLAAVVAATDDVLQEAKQGAVIREGLQVVIAGKPNAGKSSLLNALAGRDAAIVTDIAGTTRDVLREHIAIDGLPLHIIDTAGLRDSDDIVEQEGIRRAWAEIERADLVLLLVDSSKTTEKQPDILWREVTPHARPAVPTLVVQNKIDVSGLSPEAAQDSVCVSAKTGAGIADLRARLRQQAGLSSAGEGRYSARARHVDALQRTADLLVQTQQRFHATGAGELLAEDLKLAQNYLGEITGAVSSDDLLGKIFGSFCIGK
ncbi:MAG: tRNA uridine-5-carboxymethylaminomethyl(34) synthesis GTPase MnmE [Pseudomonadales bacterium]